MACAGRRIVQAMNHDPTDLAGHEATRTEKQDRARLAAQVEADDIKWLMGSKRGRRIVRRLLERFGVWQSSFAADALLMAFNEGRRNEGLVLLALVTHHAPERYAEMLKES